MIIDFHKCYGGGGSGSGVTPQEVQAQIDSALTPYWDSAATESAITAAISGISLDGYYTSGQTDEKISSAVTPVANHLAEVEQITASAYTELHDDILALSARTPDMSAFWNSAETKSYVDSAATNLQDQIDTMDEVVADALNDLNGELANKVSSSSVSTIWKGTQAEYDLIVTKDPATFYIIVSSN